MGLKMATGFTFIILVLSLCSSVLSDSTPVIISNPDRYEVRDGRYYIEHLVDQSGTRWTRKVSLERLEVLANDMILDLPFESCTEEKLTRQNKYADHLGQNSKFEEIHQVIFSFVHLF